MNDETDGVFCPSCSTDLDQFIVESQEGEDIHPNYCPNCGEDVRSIYTESQEVS